MSAKIQMAELLARFVHFGQKRWDGEDYIKHCERVANQIQIQLCGYNVLPTKEQGNIICAAWLHDCIEDFSHPETVAQLILEIFGEDIYEIVVNLTHANNPRFCFEDYNSYIEYVFELSWGGFRKYNPMVREIKFLDMIDNTSYNNKPKQIEKYRQACLHLQSKGIEIPEILRKRLNVSRN